MNQARIVIQRSFRGQFWSFRPKNERQVKICLPIGRPSAASPVRLSTTHRYQSSLPNPHPSQTPDDHYTWLPLMLFRMAAAFGMVHVVSEYGVSITLCEGPSMQPTIQSSGEIILVDLLTPRLFRSTWDGQERTKQARKRQEQHPDATWHEPVIPANEFPSRKKWRRLVQQMTSGISVGDVLVVQHPRRSGTVCKRVLGMPGDTVLVSPDNKRGFTECMTVRQSSTEGQKPSLLTIPDGHVWLEGDNAFNSSDSRQYGPLPAAMVVGRVLCRVWPLRGDARIERGGRPTVEYPPGIRFPGSTILPAGYEGEEIIRKVEP